MNLENVKLFLDEFETCVISTVGVDNQPESATVGFSQGSDYKILIATNNKTRKAANLEKNNKVAIVVGFDGPKTVQIEGQALKIDPTTNEDRINLHFEKVPASKKFADDDGQNYYLITPTWLRHTDYKRQDPVFETKDIS